MFMRSLFCLFQAHYLGFHSLKPIIMINFLFPIIYARKTSRDTLFWSLIQLFKRCSHLCWCTYEDCINNFVCILPNALLEKVEIDAHKCILNISLCRVLLLELTESIQILPHAKNLSWFLISFTCLNHN